MLPRCRQKISLRPFFQLENLITATSTRPSPPKIAIVSRPHSTPSRTLFSRSFSKPSLYSATFQKAAFTSIADFGEEKKNVVPFLLADIGEGIAECEILQWFVKEGDHVEQFQKVCEVQSDKANVEITSPYDGVIDKIYYEVGDMALVKTPLLDVRIENIGANTSAQPSASAAPILADEAGNGSIDASIPVATSSILAAPAAASGPKMALATPAIRHLAKLLGVDINTVHGTGPEGRVLEADVRSHMVKDRREPIRGLMRTMVKTMDASLAIPHLHYVDEVDVTRLVMLRSELKACAAEQGVRLTLMPLFLKATSLALREFPILNTAPDFAKMEIVYHQAHNIAIAVDTTAGLLVPVVKNVQEKSLLQIAADLERVHRLAVEGKLQSSDMSGATIAISNIGSIGGVSASAIISPPQVAIGAFGRVRTLPRFDESGAVVPRSILTISWAADHRVIDGATVAKFSNHVKNLLEAPTAMFLDLK